MKFVLLLLAPVTLVFGSESAGKKLLADCLAALGGDKFLAMQDRLETGRAYSFYREQLTGLAQARIYTKYVPQSNAMVKTRERQSFGKEETSAVVFFDDKAYQITFRGVRPLKKDQVERSVESNHRNIFYILRMRLKEPGLLFDDRGTGMVENTPVRVLDITDVENQVTTVYLHHLSNLPVKQLAVRRDPDTKRRIEETTRFSKYRDVGDGVQWPFNILRERNGEKTFELFSESVAINQGLSDSLFALPSGAKMLPESK